MEIKQLVIEESRQGQRLDNYLFSLMRHVAKGRIYRMLRKGEVRVNGKRAKPDQRLETGDRIRVPFIGQESPSSKPLDLTDQIDHLKNAILFEDKDMLVVNKPSGMAVHAGSHIGYGLIDIIKQAYPQCPDIELAHRIDRDTSGCLMLAKKRSVLKALHAAFREHEIKKSYCVLVAGRWPKHVHTIDAPLKRIVHSSGERIVKVLEDGQTAKTHIEVIAASDKASFIKVFPMTGRTHQIRVHCQWAGHPILGDTKYAFSKEAQSLARGINIKRMMLHAHTLNWEHPKTEERLSCMAPLDDHWGRALNILGLGADPILD